MAASKKLIGMNGAPTEAPFRLSASPHTDISREGGIPNTPPIQFSAPLLKYVIPTASFKSARLTIHAPEGLPLEWDQAGFTFIWPTAGLPEPDAEHPGDENTAPLFVKAGIEHFQGQVWGTNISNKGEIDWSIYPLPNGRTEESLRVTFEVVKYGKRLVTLLVGKDAEGKEVKQPTRAVPWCFDGEETRETLWVSVFASRPDWHDAGRGPLEIEVEEFQIEYDQSTVKLV
jgi:hypothetical protein